MDPAFFYMYGLAVPYLPQDVLPWKSKIWLRSYIGWIINSILFSCSLLKNEWRTVLFSAIFSGWLYFPSNLDTYATPISRVGPGAASSSMSLYFLSPRFSIMNNI